MEIKKLKMDNEQNCDRLERYDTEDSLIIPEVYEYLTAGNNSFNQHFDSETISQLTRSPPQQIFADEDKNELQSILFENNKEESLNNVFVTDSATNNVASTSNMHVPVCNQPGFKKIVHIGEKFVMVENGYRETYSQSSPEAIVNADVPSDTSPPPYNDNNYLGFGNVGTAPSLSLQAWPGTLDFSLIFNTNKHNSTKWRYSSMLEKLFVNPTVAFPVELQVSDWINAYVNITPVYVRSENHTLPVTRCINHKIQDEQRGFNYSDHIVQVEDPGAHYKVTNDRPSIDIPLGTPPPGENSKLILVKLGCWSSCVGGPNRKEFCLIFTLFSGDHVEIGRNILHLKVCSCPKRDMGLAEKSHREKMDGSKIGKKISSPKKVKKDKKIEKISSKRIKLEPQTDFVNIRVPACMEQQVKKYVNMLAATIFVEKFPSYKPYFPDV